MTKYFYSFKTEFVQSSVIKKKKQGIFIIRNNFIIYLFLNQFNETGSKMVHIQ